MNIDKTKPVLVTGANGYVASWLVKMLLEQGMTVHAAVRDPDNTKKVGHLHTMAADAPGTLTLFAAELFAEGSYAEAMQGCEVVFHTASPFLTFGVKDAQKQLVDPAVKGTENVLNSVNATPTVKRVVLTSSVVSVYGDNVDMTKQGIAAFTENHWNTTSSVDHQPYPYSKVMAEKAAWTLCEAQDRWDLVTINPGFVLGPSLTTASASTSLATMRQFGNGDLKMGAPQLQFGVVDVRDVAQAHMNAAFIPEAAGRYLTSAGEMNMLAMGQAIKTRVGAQYPVPNRHLPKFLVWLAAPAIGIKRKFVSLNVGHPIKFDNSKIKRELGIEFRAMEQTVAEHFQQMVDDKIV